MQIDKHIKKRWVLRKHQRYKIGLFIILYNKCALTYTNIHTNIIILYIKVDCKINQFFATKQIYFSSDFVLCALLSRLFFFLSFYCFKKYLCFTCCLCTVQNRPAIALVLEIRSCSAWFSHVFSKQVSMQSRLSGIERVLQRGGSQLMEQLNCAITAAFMKRYLSLE